MTHIDACGVGVNSSQLLAKGGQAGLESDLIARREGSSHCIERRVRRHQVRLEARILLQQGVRSGDLHQVFYERLQLEPGSGDVSDAAGRLIDNAGPKTLDHLRQTWGAPEQTCRLEDHIGGVGCSSPPAWPGG